MLFSPHKLGGLVRIFISILVTSLVLVMSPPATGVAGVPANSARTTYESPRADTGNVCLDSDVSSLLSSAQPGGLLAPPQDVTAESGLIEGRLYRVLYATSAPNGKAQAACAMVATPEGTSINSFLVEGHGAWGLKQECQPSMKVTNFVSSPDPSAQGAGPLFSTVKSGGVFVAPDFPAAGTGSENLQPIGHGVAQGVSMLDAARVVTGNPTEFGLAPVASDAEIPLVFTGYSQGGGAALWAAQLTTFYLNLRRDRTLNLAGVIAYEPAGTQIVAAPQEPRSLDGFHFADRISYGSLTGSIYLSWVARSWSQIRQADSGALPFGPSGGVQLSSVLSKTGVQTSAETVRFCSSEQLLLGLTVAKYRNPNSYRLLQAPFAGAKTKGVWKSAFDVTCSKTSGLSRPVRNVCAWLQFNTIGPNGLNPFPKLPTDNAGELVPIHLVHGTDDHTVWCVDSEGAVEPRNCLTAQFYDSLASAYCGGNGYLHADYMIGVGHGGIYWPSFTNRETGGWYFGSPFETFVSGALAKTLPKTCGTTNLEPIQGS